MGVIVDTGLQKEIDQLEAKGAFSLADTFRSAHQISAAALASMAFIPPEYQALVASTAVYQAAQLHHDEKAKHEEEERKHREAERAAAYQQEIDENMLHLNIDGEDLQISQGDLRKVMQHRVEELEKQKKELEKNGGDPKELRRINNLLDEYKPVIDDLQNHKADPSTMNAIQDLIEHDPKLNQEVKAAQHAENAALGMSATTQQPSAVESASAAPASLKVAFVQSALPTTSSPSTQVAPPIEQEKRQAKNSFAAFT